MKSYVRISSFVVICIGIFLSVQLTNAQWVGITGPGPTSVTAFAKHGSALLAGTNGNGIHSSSDNGITWRTINGAGPANFAPTMIRSLYSTGTRIIAGSYASGLYFSTDGGSSWTRYATVSSGASINGIVKTDTVIFAGGAGMWRSLDKGVTWVSATSGLTNTNVRGMGTIGNLVFAGTDGGIFKSTNLGVTWSKSDSGMGGTTKYAGHVVSSNGVLYANISNGYSGGGVIYKSTNNGITWDSSNGNLSSLSLTDIECYGDTVFVGLNNNKLVRSTNKGTSWTSITTGVAQYPYVIFIDNNRVYVGGNAGNFAGDGGVFVSTNNGTDWSRTTSAMLSGSVRSFGKIGENLLMGIDAGNTSALNGVYVSTNHGSLWNKPSTTLSANGNQLKANVMLVKGSKIFVAASSNVPYGVFASTDGGTTWSSTNTGLYQYADVYQFLADADTIYIASKEGLFRTTNDGANWTPTQTGIPAGEVKSIVMRGDTLYASNASNKLYRSENRGRTWTSKTTDLPQYIYLYKLFVSGEKLFTIGGDGAGGLYQSLDSGSHWTAVNAATFSGNGLVLNLVIAKQNIFALTNAAGIYLSTNNGTTWTQINKGISGSYPNFSNVFVAWDSVYASMGGSVYRAGLSDFGITKVEEIQSGITPQEFALEQNYPNPFNPSTTIRFNVQPLGATTLKVYDIVGREVATLVNENLKAGTYEVKFNASKLSSGIYFYQLHSGNYSATKRMILLK
ncbi:MAG: DUF6242 domain-containing protein [Bacteroidota bacterium]|nr:DUF6242 domain-containing protein [Bacteroidota bacterium]